MKPVNGVAIDWDAATPPLKCPHCSNDDPTMIEVAGREGYCNVCGKAFTLPKT